MQKKTIAVLGAGPGLGNHIAERFGREDFRVVLMSRRADALSQYVQEMEAQGVEAASHVVDCASAESVREALRWVVEEYGRVDVVAYNTCVLKGGSPLELDPDELVERYCADVAGALAAVQAAVPDMLERGEGAILFTGGGLAFDPAPEFLSVSIHKAALRGLAIALSKQLEGTGVFSGIVNVKGNIGSDEYYAPSAIAEKFWQLYEGRDNVEITY